MPATSPSARRAASSATKSPQLERKHLKMEDPEEQASQGGSEDQQLEQAKAYFETKKKYLLAEGFIEEDADAPHGYKLTEGGMYYAEQKMREMARIMFGFREEQ